MLAQGGHRVKGRGKGKRPEIKALLITPDNAGGNDFVRCTRSSSVALSGIRLKTSSQVARQAGLYRDCIEQHALCEGVTLSLVTG